MTLVLSPRSAGPIALRVSLCITARVPAFETHEFRLGSPAASIVGMTQQLLERGDLDDDVALRVRAIRDLALQMVGDAERATRRSEQE
jgi:hypothetical protein